MTRESPRSRRGGLKYVMARSPSKAIRFPGPMNCLTEPLLNRRVGQPSRLHNKPQDRHAQFEFSHLQFFSAHHASRMMALFKSFTLQGLGPSSAQLGITVLT